MTAIKILLHALTPLHAGGGEAESGIEQAIARDRATGRPLLPAASLKGVLREAARKSMNPSMLKCIFGPDTQGASEHRGGVAFGDANLLVLPVRSVCGTFAWVTCSFVLRHWSQLHTSIGGLDKIGLTIPDPPTANNALICDGSAIVATARNGQSRVYLEDLDLLVTKEAATGAWAEHFSSLVFPGVAWESWRTRFAQRFCIVHDDVFSFLADYATQLDPHVALSSDKRVENFWHEESLPSESILGSVCVIDPLPSMQLEHRAIANALRSICVNSLQFGGHETVGRGLSRVVFGGKVFDLPTSETA